jgi:hypothetical protein
VKKFLSIDPGETTGVAAYEGSDLSFTMTLSSRKLLSNGFLNKLLSMATPEVILIEDVPKFKPDPHQLILVAELVRWFRVAGFEVVTIQPSQWKNFVSRVEIPGQHARDAASMGRWFISQSEEE